MMTQRPMLNGGCGNIILPCEQPAHHALVNPAIYHFPLWVNADRNPAPGVDCVTDLFQVPWEFPDNSFDGALFSHFMEHVPHEIKLRDDSPRAKELAKCQDGWYAVWAEVYRTLTPGALVHILSPYGWSQGAITDPTHTRLLTEHTWTHSMQPDPNAPFSYETGGIHFEVVNVTFGLYQNWQHLLTHPHDNAETVSAKQAKFNELLRSQINVVNDMYAKLRVVK
jgi:hypothetical protein